MIRVYFYVIAVEPDTHSNQVVFSDIMLFIKVLFRPSKQILVVYASNALTISSLRNGQVWAFSG